MIRVETFIRYGWLFILFISNGYVRVRMFFIGRR